jgi:hypothetical protein
MHYYLLLVPPICVLAAAPTARWLSSHRWTLFFVVAPVVFFLGFARYNDWFLDVTPRERDLPRAVGEWIRGQTPPSARLQVWGNSPEIYFHAQRRMGSRFLFTNYQCGKIWGTASDEEGAAGTERHIVPESWPLLMGDLEAHPPDVLVDAAAGGLRHFAGHGIERYPQLEAFVERCYRPWTNLEGVQLYRRAACGAEAGIKR